MSLLQTIKTPADLKQLKVDELPQVAEEIRQRIIRATDLNGGHLASSLGAVDIIVALYYVFDFPKDKIIFDVGHQAYAHKILSGRLEQFDSIRTEGGLSGFPSIFESEYDAFTVGHAGTSIAASLGYCYSRDKLKQDYYVISLVGDASLFNGENMEALFANEQKPKKLLIILNDNGMSISKNGNGLYKALTKMSMKKKYSRFMGAMNKLFGWNFIGRFLKGIKAAFKRSLDPFVVLDTVDLKYVGPFDGHNIKSLVKIFESFRSSPRATLLHLKTTKGKGFEPAEANADILHGVSKHMTTSENTFSNCVCKLGENLIADNDKIVFLTAGMLLGTGLKELSEKYPGKVFDVGISEEYCVTLAAGMAVSGLRPIVCMYSTFLQRAYDQTVVDVCLQNLPVIFMIDRAGLVGSDGATHQGVFDLSYLSHIPNMTILVPKDTDELSLMLDHALSLNTPVAIRYPNGICPNFETVMPFDREHLWEEVVISDSEYCIYACGPRMLDIALKASKKLSVTVVNARTVKPLDDKTLNKYSDKKIITLEDNSETGGFGSMVMNYYQSIDICANVKIVGVKDKFVEHASVKSQLAKNDMTVEYILNLFNEKNNQQ